MSQSVELINNDEIDILKQKVPYSYKLSYYDDDYDTTEDYLIYNRRPTIGEYILHLTQKIKKISRTITKLSDNISNYDSILNECLGVTFNDLQESYNFLEKHRNIKSLQLTPKYREHITISLPSL